MELLKDAFEVVYVNIHLPNHSRSLSSPRSNPSSPHPEYVDMHPNHLVFTSLVISRMYVNILGGGKDHTFLVRVEGSNPSGAKKKFLLTLSSPLSSLSSLY